MMYRCVARTQSIEEAAKVAEHYELQGFKTKILQKKEAGITLYEVWAGKEPDILGAKGMPKGRRPRIAE